MKKIVVKIKNDNVTLIEINDVLSVNFGALDRGNVADTTNCGVYSNNGKIAFIDKTKTFKTVISNYSNLNVGIYYYSNGIKKQIANFLIDDYDYNDENKKVTLTLKDNLLGWQNQKNDEYSMPFTHSIEGIFTHFFIFSAGRTEGAVDKMAVSSVGTLYMPSATKWSNADKICQATMTRCFCDIEGTPMFADETPKQSNNIVIRPQNILSIGNATSKNKTKIQKVSISA
jgi:hypothetical protein